MKTAAERPVPQRSSPVAVLRVVLTLLAVLGLHLLGEIGRWYFVLVGCAAIVLAAGTRTPIPGFRALLALDPRDRGALWIVLTVCAIVGYLHGSNTWAPDGSFYRPRDLALWKSELVLTISVGAPLIHWLLSIPFPRAVRMDGRRFVNEFALYVNFSGIALLIWAGEPVVSAYTVGALLALLALVELTLAATD